MEKGILEGLEGEKGRINVVIELQPQNKSSKLINLLTNLMNCPSEAHISE